MGSRLIAAAYEPCEAVREMTGKAKEPAVHPGVIAGGAIVAGFVATLIVSKSLRTDFFNAVGWGPHPSEEGWSKAFDREKELAQLTGEWLPRAPDERGCTWSVKGPNLTQRCPGKSDEEKTLEVEAPGVLLVRKDKADGWEQKRYGYARLGDATYVGPGVTGKRVNGVVVLDDSQGRVVLKDGQCLYYRMILVIGGRHSDWERTPTPITCWLAPEHFDYKTVGYHLARGNGESGFAWMETSVQVRGDALFSKTLEDYPLVPK